MDLTRNAISPAKAGSLGVSQTGSTLDPIASAVVSSIATTAGSMPTREELQAAADESKPRPKPNITAEAPAEVYPLEDLLGRGMLRQMTVKEWQDAVDAKTEILTQSRFVSHRIPATVEAGDVRRLKSLKYLLLLLEWYSALVPASKGLGRKVKQRDKLREQLGSWGSELVDGVSRRFAEGSILSRWHVDNLITHICALAITIDDFAIDVYDIREDLKLENKQIKQYFQELGCRVAAPTQNEMARMKIEKKEAAQHQVAKLRLPLAFPKMRVTVQKKRR